MGNAALRIYLSKTADDPKSPAQSISNSIADVASPPRTGNAMPPAIAAAGMGVGAGLGGAARAGLNMMPNSGALPAVIRALSASQPKYNPYSQQNEYMQQGTGANANKVKTTPASWSSGTVSGPGPHPLKPPTSSIYVKEPPPPTEAAPGSSAVGWGAKAGSYMESGDMGMGSGGGAGAGWQPQGSAGQRIGPSRSRLIPQQANPAQQVNPNIQGGDSIFAAAQQAQANDPAAGLMPKLGALAVKAANPIPKPPSPAGGVTGPVRPAMPKSPSPVQPPMGPPPVPPGQAFSRPRQRSGTPQFPGPEMATQGIPNYDDAMMGAEMGVERKMNDRQMPQDYQDAARTGGRVAPMTANDVTTSGYPYRPPVRGGSPTGGLPPVGAGMPPGPSGGPPIGSMSGGMQKINSDLAKRAALSMA
jgi:hypothetical protein